MVSAFIGGLIGGIIYCALLWRSVSRCCAWSRGWSAVDYAARLAWLALIMVVSAGDSWAGWVLCFIGVLAGRSLCMRVLAGAAEAVKE